MKYYRIDNMKHEIKSEVIELMKDYIYDII